MTSRSVLNWFMLTAGLLTGCGKSYDDGYYNKPQTVTTAYNTTKYIVTLPNSPSVIPSEIKLYNDDKLLRDYVFDQGGTTGFYPYFNLRTDTVPSSQLLPGSVCGFYLDEPSSVNATEKHSATQADQEYDFKAGSDAMIQFSRNLSRSDAQYCISQMNNLKGYVHP